MSTLVIAPTFAAATTVSQSNAQSLDLAIAGSNVISQITTASNDGTTETSSDGSTIPKLVSAIPGNSLIGAGVLAQSAVAKKDGTSYACAGVAGTGGGIVTVGDSSCNLDGSPLTISLANLHLGDAILGNDSVLGNLLNGIPGLGGAGGLLDGLGIALNTLVGQISTAIGGTPLGDISIGGSLSAIEASCVADPTSATGDARLADTSGGSAVTPISITLPEVGKIDLVDLPANPPPNTHLLTNLNVVTAAVIGAVKQELNKIVNGQLTAIATPLGKLLDAVQTQLVDTLVTSLEPLLKPLEQYLADITLNKQVSSDGGKKIEVTAIDAQILGAATPLIGGPLISGEIGKVTCGPNAKPAVATPPTTTPTGGNPKPPTVVDSGANGSNTARDVLTATAALMLLAGSAGLIGYRRMLTK
ncbi:MAG TPA: hypothetical protein VFE15_08525 [Marmoricola sp.]|nr:hypothetical protein [Marmoricola sp.]